MYSERVRRQALALLAEGRRVGAVSRELGIDRSTVRSWRDQPQRPRPRGECPLCEPVDLDEPAYAALLGFYLGDGCISAAARFYVLRISCDVTYPGIVSDVTALMERVRPGIRVFFVNNGGAVNVQSHWKHWPCLFPQHGPGRKHERPIVLEPWQTDIVTAHPAPFLRGLFHSDGCRAANWTRRMVAGEWKRYDYPRWQFANNSAQIRDLCTAALDLLDIPWRQSNATIISVSRRDAVARLDRLIGLKC